MTEDHLVPADPGWRAIVLQMLPRFVLPVGFGRSPKSGDGRPPVLAARGVFLAFVSAVLTFLLVLPYIHPVVSDRQVPAAVYLLLGVGPVAVGFVPWARRRLLDTFDEEGGLARHYATSFFLGIALAETPALLAFVATFLAEAVWPYVVGMLVSLGGFAMIAPTGTRIRRLDESLSSRGCNESLRAALYTPNEPGSS